MELLPPHLPLTEAEGLLHESAASLMGFDDFGGDEYLEGLRALLRSADEDADLSDTGRQSCAGIVVTALAGRLASEGAKKANPAYREVSIEAPLVILGLPRTGTTALHRMLCAADENQGLELWLAQHPLPRPERSLWNEHPAYQRCVSELDAQYAAAPEMASIHAMAADAVDECWNLLRQSFTSVTFECAARVQGYASWWQNCDMGPAYRRWADNLRLIGLADVDKRWILKDPSHLFAPESLLATLPDATIVMTHRDPARSIPSVCSLSAAAHIVNDRVPDDALLGQEQLELWARGIGRMMEARQSQPERFVDVQFHDFMTEPLAVVRRIYERVGATLDPAAERAMRQWLAANPSKPHQYGAARFGLTEAGIRERYTDYIDTYGVQLES